MKYSALIAVAAATLASAQCVSSIPECAQKCIVDAAASSTSCGATDYECQCTTANQAAIQGAATSCVISACGADVAVNDVLPASSAFCSAINAGKTCSESGSASSGAASSTAASSSAASSSAAAETTSSASETEASSTLVVSTTVTSAAESSTAAATTTAAESSTTAASSTSASVTAVTTAGAAIAGSMGTLGMLVLGALAL